MKKTIFTTIFVILLASFACAQTMTLGYDEVDMQEAHKEDILHQLYVYDEVSEYLADLFQQFSEGYVEPAQALDSVNLLMHEYAKKTRPVPAEAQKLNSLMKHLLSRIENYFIIYQRAYRELPELNRKLVEARMAVMREAERLRIQYMH